MGTTYAQVGRHCGSLGAGTGHVTQAGREGVWWGGGATTRTSMSSYVGGSGARKAFVGTGGVPHLRLSSLTLTLTGAGSSWDRGGVGNCDWKTLAGVWICWPSAGGWQGGSKNFETLSILSTLPASRQVLRARVPRFPTERGRSVDGRPHVGGVGRGCCAGRGGGRKKYWGKGGGGRKARDEQWEKSGGLQVVFVAFPTEARSAWSRGAPAWASFGGVSGGWGDAKGVLGQGLQRQCAFGPWGALNETPARGPVAPLSSSGSSLGGRPVVS